MLLTPVFLGFTGSSDNKEFTCSVGDLGLIPGLGRSPGEGNSYPLQYSALENSMDCIVRGVAESDKTERLSLSRSSGSHRDSESVGGERFLSQLLKPLVAG